MASSRYVALRTSLGLAMLLVTLLEPHANSQNATSQSRSSSSSQSAQQKKDEKASQQKKSENNSTERASESSNVDLSLYVGTQTCKGCHEDVGNKFAANPHSKTLTNKRLDRQGCEACHGPGQSHAEAGDPENIVRFESLSKAETWKTCSQCHDLSKGRGQAVHQQHGKGEAGCLDCHTIHAAKVQHQLLKSERAKLCSACHASRE